MSLSNKASPCYGYAPEYKQYIPAGVLPFRSRERDMSKPCQHVKWRDSSKSSRFNSSSPTSVIDQPCGDLYPCTPSPVCSPSSSTVTSPRHSISSQDHLNPSQLSHHPPETHDNEEYAKGNAEKLPPEGDSSSRNPMFLSTESGLLTLLTSKLLSYRDSRFLQHSGERSESSVHEKHIVDGDRSCKPPVEEIPVDGVPQDWSQTLSHTPSDTPSELSLGSSYERTLSMEFDAVLAAAVAAGIGQASPDNEAVGPSEITRAQLPGIEENRNSRGSLSEREQDEIEGGDMRYALVPVTTNAHAVPQETSTALTILGHVMDENISRSGRSSRNSSRGSEGREPEEGVASRAVQVQAGQDNERRMQEPDRHHSADFCSMSSHGSSHALCLSQSGSVLPPTSKELALQKVRSEKIFAKALAFQEAKNARHENRYKREEAKIRAWENQQRIKASVSMKKVELKLEQKRAKAYEKMQNEIALARKKAEERKATAAARKGIKLANVADRVERIKKAGKIPSGWLFV